MTNPEAAAKLLPKKCICNPNGHCDWDHDFNCPRSPYYGKPNPQARPSPDHAGLVGLLEEMAGDFDTGQDKDWEDGDWMEAAKLLRRAAAALLTPLDRETFLRECVEALRELTNQLWLLSKDPENNPWVKQGQEALAKLEQAGGE